MDQVTLVKNQVRAQNRYKLIEECQSGGQTVVSWCKENDVNIKTYYYWLQKFRQQEIEKRHLAGLSCDRKIEDAPWRLSPIEHPRFCVST